MIPFATWSQAQIEREVPVWEFPTRHLLNEAEQAVQSDLADLVDGIVENLHQSTVVQLRTTLKLAGTGPNNKPSSRNLLSSPNSEKPKNVYCPSSLTCCVLFLQICSCVK
jgi:hypothetical protein